MAWVSNKYPLFDGRLSWAVTAYALALIVILAQPVASFAWLGGAHATIEQSALHEEAVKHAHLHHHGGLHHHEHQPGDRASTTDAQFSRTVLGPAFASAAISTIPFHDLLQATLTIPPGASSPDVPPSHASLVEVVLPQHSPPVQHRPPIFF